MMELFNKHPTIMCLTAISIAAILMDHSGMVLTLWLMYGIYKLIVSE